MSEDDPFGNREEQPIRRPTPGRQSAEGPFSGQTLVRPKSAPMPSGDETVVRPRQRRSPLTPPPDPSAAAGPGPQTPAQRTPPSAHAALEKPWPDPRETPFTTPSLAATSPQPFADGLRGFGVTNQFDDNPLVKAARSLLSSVTRLRGTVICENIVGLQKDLSGEIKNFQSHLLQDGVSQEETGLASYALCALLDEAVLNTPWGKESFWGNQTLLVQFHKEAFGGEKFFQFLDRLLRAPAQNRNLIELLWLCLALGFEGKYRLIANGANELERVQNAVYQTIRRDGATELSPRWQGVSGHKNPLIEHIPAWVIAAVAGGLLVLIFAGFSLSISGRSDAVARELYAVANEVPSLAPRLSNSPPIISAPAPKAERFKSILKNEIQHGMVEVVDDRILRIRNSFPPGSDQLKPDYIPLFSKIAQELGRGGDTVLITGHTDDKPIFSARFPSNFELSAARARRVTDLLMSTSNLNGKVRFEGRSDFEPLVPNDSTEHRAINRRVDILIQ